MTIGATHVIGQERNGVKVDLGPQIDKAAEPSESTQKPPEPTTTKPATCDTTAPEEKAMSETSLVLDAPKENTPETTEKPEDSGPKQPMVPLTLAATNRKNDPELSEVRVADLEQQLKDTKKQLKAEKKTAKSADDKKVKKSAAKTKVAKTKAKPAKVTKRKKQDEDEDEDNALDSEEELSNEETLPAESASDTEPTEPPAAEAAVFLWWCLTTFFSLPCIILYQTCIKISYKTLILKFK